MRRSEFERAVVAEFGRRADAVTRDLALPQLGSITARDALAAGADPREVWLALCTETDVPAERRYGVGLIDPRR